MRTPSGPTLIPHTSPCTSSSLARKMSLSSPKTGPCRGSLLSGLAPRLRGLDQPQQGGPDDRRAEETLFLSGRIRVNGRGGDEGLSADDPRQQAGVEGGGVGPQ